MKRKTKSELPRSYLSWSQIDLVERNPDEYVKRYIYGEQQEENDYMRFGTETHKRLSNGKEDVKILCKLKRGKKEVTLLGYLDDEQDGVQIEYKTATKLWTPQKARNHGQMKVYALIGYKNTGQIPKQRLVCHGTANMGDMVLTGERRAFEIQYELKDMLETEARVWKAHDKIQKLVAEELNKIF